MASSVQAYSITITNGNTNLTPADGFVDNKKVEDYRIDFQSPPGGLTLDVCQAKRRGNVRWIEIINQLQMIANCYVDPNSFVSDATAIAEASSFAFQIYTEHGAASLVTADELNAGSFLTGTDCIVRCVARALNADLFKKIDIFDPTKGTTVGILGAANSEIRYGMRIGEAADFEIGPYEGDLATAEGFVAVAAL